MNIKCEKDMCDVGAPVEPNLVPGFEQFGHVSLQGVANCRDLGGLPTADGRRIKKRRLLRSAELHDATPEDIKQLTAMHNLEFVVDLRSEYELENSPDPLSIMPGIEYVNLPPLSDNSIGFTGLKHLKRDWRAFRKFRKGPYKMVQALYPRCILGEKGKLAYSRLLNDLAAHGAGDGATLWHCTQGKDRTGIAALLIEYALGVPMEYIERDYLATNLFVGPMVEKTTDAMRDNIFLRSFGVDLQAYAYANSCYLACALDAIFENYGSIENYMDKALDFDADKRAALREMYLE